LGVLLLREGKAKQEEGMMVKKGKIKQRKKSRREGRKVREGRAREKRVYEDRKKARGKKRKEKGEPPPLNSHFWLRH